MTIYDVDDNAKSGDMPVEGLTKRYLLAYDEQRVGITRYYTAQQNHKNISKVIRVPRVDGINNQQKAQTEDGKVYEIEQVQTVIDVYPPCLDLTLVSIEGK